MDPEMLQQAKKKKAASKNSHFSSSGKNSSLLLSVWGCGDAVSTVLSVGGGFVPADCSLVWSVSIRLRSQG